jgi:membrane protein YqaA with SNARE-associated domain
MFSHFQNHFKKSLQVLQSFADRLWYAPLIGFLAGLDAIILIVPTDGLLISSCILKPQRWFGFAVAVAVGSTVGGLVLAGLIEMQGLPWILNLYPGLDQSWAWKMTDDFFKLYGLWVLFAVSVAPLPQQPAIVLASLSTVSLPEMTIVLFVGRFFKFIFMAYLGAKAPQLLSKVWGLKGELDEVGIKIKKAN